MVDLFILSFLPILASARMHVELLMEQATYAVQQDGHQDIHEEYSDRGINAAPIYEASEPGTYSESSLRSRSRSRDPPSDLASEYYRPMPSVSPLLNTDPTTYEVRDLPGLSTSSSADGQVSLRRHWSGHIPLLFAGQESYGSAFFWLFEPDLSARDQPLKEEEDDASLPLIIWLNGGPGCSSMAGLFQENGPLRVTEDAHGQGGNAAGVGPGGRLRVAVNPHSWHSEGYLLYVDQPLGTGLSYLNSESCGWCDYVQNQTTVNVHMYSTLQSLYRIFPHLLVGRDVVLTGESYAGHYIPAMADYFLALNDALTNPSVGPGHVLSNPNGDVAIPVVSIAIGNGWSIPRIQYNYAEFARNMGIISSPDADRLTTQYRACLDQQRRGDFRGSRACNIIGQVLAASGACPFQSSIAADDELDDDTYSQSETDDGDDSSACYGPVVNYYDVRLYADIGSVWPDTDTITATYLNLPEVRAAIHVQGNTNPFEECNRAGSRLALMDGLGVETQIVRLLERGVPMTFYSGQYDLVCNHMGNEQMLDQLKWSGADDFRSARGFVWTLLGQSPTGIKVSSPTSRDSSTSDNSDSGHGNHSKGADVSAEVPPLSTASNSKTASLPSVPTAPQRRVPAGYGRSTADGRLTFLVVIGASHMVPYDVPASAQDIIKRVVRKRSFADYTQKMTFNRTTARRSDTVSAKTVIDELKRDASSILVSLTQLPYPTHYVLFAGVLVFICTYSCVRACCCGPRRRHNDALYSRGSQHIYVELPQ